MDRLECRSNGDFPFFGATAGSSVKFCATGSDAQCRDDVVAVSAWCRGGRLDGDGASPVELPVAAVPPLDRIRAWTVGWRLW